MQHISQILQQIDGFIGGSQWFVFLLLGTGLFFTIYLKFPQIRYFKHAVRIVKGTYDRKTDVGDTSHFQALATALSGTVGTGNIAGVALAIHLGGPAALFWMLITAMLGMTTKFVEVTLSHKYREKASDGSIAGGPMYFMKNRLNMKWLAIIFAVATVFSSFGTGSLPQINSISNAMFASFGINHILTGGILALLLGFVIIGGIKRIAKVTEKLVPIMAIFYFVGSISVIIYNYQNILPALGSIFTNIFTGTAAAGGFLGAGISYAFNRGVNRGLFSNEAGQGSAPIAHAAARAHEPVSEGIVAILEPFIDTIIICFLTGLVLLSSGVWQEKFTNRFQNADLIVLDQTYSQTNENDVRTLSDFISKGTEIQKYSGDLEVVNGKIITQKTILHARSIAEDISVLQGNKPFTGRMVIANGKLISSDENNADNESAQIHIDGKSLLHSAPLTNEAFKRSFFGDWGQYIVAIGLLLFAFSTAISWSYYGERSMTFLFGIKSVIYYRIIYVIAFFFAAFTDTTIVWIVSGITIAFMTIPNLFGILLLHREMKTTIKEYWLDFSADHPDVKIPEKLKY